MKKIFAISLLLIIVFVSGCSADPASQSPDASPDTGNGGGISVGNNPQATITMENGDIIVLELYPDKAPNTVCNFISLANSGFYDGTTFHRVGKDFMIQGGDPTATGMGDPGYSIKGEFTNNNFSGNDISHEEGVISMARGDNRDSAGCQFFICAGECTYLDGGYAAFGKTISGLEFVKEMASLNTDMNGGPPSSPLVMESITVETFGVEYPEPEVVK